MYCLIGRESKISSININKHDKNSYQFGICDPNGMHKGNQHKYDTTLTKQSIANHQRKTARRSKDKMYFNEKNKNEFAVNILNNQEEIRKTNRKKALE